MNSNKQGQEEGRNERKEIKRDRGREGGMEK